MKVWVDREKCQGHTLCAMIAPDSFELDDVDGHSSAINEIDLSALESLDAINHRLATMDVKLHLSEVKGPVMDRLKKSHFLDQMTGQVFLSQYDAMRTLAPDHQLT